MPEGALGQSVAAADAQRAEIRECLDTGWTRRDGMRRPYVRGLMPDYELSVEAPGSGSFVVLEFSMDDFPGHRFAHRFPPHGPGNYDSISFLEDIECGMLKVQLEGLGRVPPGVVWTSFGYVPQATS